MCISDFSISHHLHTCILMVSSQAYLKSYFGDESWLTKRTFVSSCIYVHIIYRRFSCMRIFSRNCLGDLGDLGDCNPLKNKNETRRSATPRSLQAAQSMIISIDSIVSSSPRISRPQPVSGAWESHNQAIVIYSDL